MKSLYYECHITIEPVFDKKLDQFKLLCAEYGFRVAKLLMEKNVPSDKDSFCTGHNINYQDLYIDMINLLRSLRGAGFKIKRYKIENIILDSRQDDSPFELYV